MSTATGSLHDVAYDGHEHEFEAALGLPERLPRGERLLWQESPDWRALARDAFHLHQLAVYFAVILALRCAVVLSQGGSANEATRSVSMLLPLVLLALGIVAGAAWLSARTTVYTVTDKRVVMRVGIVLSLTFNLPLSCIANAGLHTAADGTGDIPLALAGGDRIAFLHLWPHTRPWRVRQPEPMLRSVPHAAEVARLLARAWQQRAGAGAAVEMAVESAADTTMQPPAGTAA